MPLHGFACSKSNKQQGNFGTNTSGPAQKLRGAWKTTGLGQNLRRMTQTHQRHPQAKGVERHPGRGHGQHEKTIIIYNNLRILYNMLNDI